MTIHDLIARIERTASDIYRASTFNSLTQARLRSIQADLDVLKTAVPLEPQPKVPCTVCASDDAAWCMVAGHYRA